MQCNFFKYSLVTNSNEPHITRTKELLKISRFREVFQQFRASTRYKRFGKEDETPRNIINYCETFTRSRIKKVLLRKTDMI